MSQQLQVLILHRDNWQNVANVHQRAMAAKLASAEDLKRMALEAQEEVRKLDLQIEALSRADQGPRP